MSVWSAERAHSEENVQFSVMEKDLHQNELDYVNCGFYLKKKILISSKVH